MSRLYLRLLVPFLLPRLEAWATRGWYRDDGRVLGYHEWNLAVRAGVQSPRAVRIMTVSVLPLSDGGLIRRLAGRAGFVGLDALTLGPDIFFRAGAETRALLAHELRHVAQYELAGSIPQFLRRYVRELAAYGYERAPLEVEARGYEALA